MFRVEHNVPDIYAKESRDFQLFSRLYDLVFQSSRFSIDSLEDASNSIYCNERLLPLLGTKVGLFTDLGVSDEIQRRVLSVFPYVMRYKGSIKAIRLLSNFFQRLTNAEVEVSVAENDLTVVNISFNKIPDDVELFKLLVDHVRPCGVKVNYKILKRTGTGVQVYDIWDNLSVSSFKSDDINTITAVNSNSDPYGVISAIEASHVVRVSNRDEECQHD